MFIHWWQQLVIVWPPATWDQCFASAYRPRIEKTWFLAEIHTCPWEKLCFYFFKCIQNSLVQRTGPDKSMYTFHLSSHPRWLLPRATQAHDRWLLKMINKMKCSSWTRIFSSCSRSVVSNLSVCLLLCFFLFLNPAPRLWAELQQLFLLCVGRRSAPRMPSAESQTEDNPYDYRRLLRKTSQRRRLIKQYWMCCHSTLWTN